MTTLTVILPVPPSANNLFANAKSGRIKTKAYVAWLEESRWHIDRAWRENGKPVLAAPITLIMRLGIGINRDVSNCIKPIEDALVAFLPGLPDDRHNDHVLAHRDRDREVGTVAVTITDT